MQESKMFPERMTPQMTAEYLGIARSTLAAWAKRPGFPAPFRPTKRTVFWLRSEVDSWLDRSRDTPAALAA